MRITLSEDAIARIFTPVSRKQTFLLVIFAFLYGALFVNYAEYIVFTSNPPSASVPPAYHLWLEVFYMVPFFSMLLFRGIYSLPFVYVLGRIASFGNDFGYPVYAKFIAQSYTGSLLDWWVWMVGLGTSDRFSWIVRMPYATFQMTTELMGLNFVVRVLIVSAFFFVAHRVRARMGSCTCAK
ncbi:MAG: hypothetical protein QFX35_04360 [Candidatus Verstraetearchaeota archaeon]|nr:hypothetical protein [Candidatus Verstraetearchaeota archaeon]